MKPSMLVASLILASVAVGVLAAAPPDVGALVTGMQRALDPARPSVRTLTLRVSGASGEPSRVTIGQVRGTVGSHRRILNVVLSPPSLRGIAYLVEEGGPKEDAQWLYIPAVGRVREMASPEAFTAFLNSDFTYADLGFVKTDARSELVGTETRDGKAVFEIESVPKQTWYYSRVVTWLASDSGLPVERDLYDSAGQLWKVEHLKDSLIDGVPTALHLSMEDVQAKTRTDVDVSAVRYDVPLPAGLLDPAALPAAVGSPLWAELGA